MASSGDGHDEGLLALLVDAVLPLLPPYEFALYLLLYRRSHAANGDPAIRIGKRAISAALGKSTRSSGGNYQHITEKLRNLEDAGFIIAGETDRRGTRYTVRAPHEVPAVRERMATDPVAEAAPDYFADPLLRQELFARDGWRCHYCGEEVAEGTVTLDHVMPQARGGDNSPDNLVTSCLMCNSLKSGRSYEEAAPLILARVAELRRKSEPRAS